MDGLRQVIFLAAPVARVWAYLTDQHKLAQWLMDNDLQAESGAHFQFSSQPAGQWDGKIHCQVQELIEQERISFSWTANDIGAETLVTFDLEAAPGGTRLTLTHQGLADAMPGAAGRHGAGWTNALKALKTALFGTDPDYDWSAFQITYFIEAPLADVYDMWATEKGMGRFWADKVRWVDPNGQVRSADQPFRIGDKVGLTFPTGTSTELEILNIEQNKFVLFSFGEDYGWVRVSFEQQGGRTRMVLRQFGLRADEQDQWEVHVNARGWWTFNLVNLKSVLLHGHDLRVREPQAASGLSSCFRPDGALESRSCEWSGFDVWLYMEAAPAAVMERWRSVDGLQSFFIAKATVIDQSGNTRDKRAFAEAGDRYSWRGIHPYEGNGRVLKSSPDRFGFTFGLRFEVEVSVLTHGTGTLFHLHQKGMLDTKQDRVHGTLNCRCCWINFITTLKSQLEHGVDLRDHDPVTADSISVGFNV